MAGVKGRSGGPRKNAGGARLGAGRKPKKEAKKPAKKSANKRGASVTVEMEGQPHGRSLKRTKSQTVPQSNQDMLTLLQQIALGKIEASTIQVKAAIAAVQFTHAKPSVGKKDQRKDAAKAASTGRFAPAAPPTLRVVK